MELARRGSQEMLPPPPTDMTKRVPMDRRGVGRKGRPVRLLTNHVKAMVLETDGHFFHYHVSIYFNDGAKAANDTWRRVLEHVFKTYDDSFSGIDYAYDGHTNLFTISRLYNFQEFTVAPHGIPSHRMIDIEDPPDGSPQERARTQFLKKHPCTAYKVEIKFVDTIPFNAIFNALNGNVSERFQESLDVLNIILREQAVKRGCPLIHRSILTPRHNFTELGGAVLGGPSFQSTFRATQGGLSLNIDVSTTIILKPGEAVIDFIMANQNVFHRDNINWIRAGELLRNMRIINTTSNFEHKIAGLSEHTCGDQTFSYQRRNIEDGGFNLPVEITVYDYYVHHRGICLEFSRDLRCINVGKPNRPIFIPIELCVMASLQRYTKALTIRQRISFAKKSRPNPDERMRSMTEAMKISDYENNALLKVCGAIIGDRFTSVKGRVLSAPKLRAKNAEFLPENGRWNLKNRFLAEPANIRLWAVVDFSEFKDVERLVIDLRKCATRHGISLPYPYTVFRENGQFMSASAPERVQKMLEEMMRTLPEVPNFLLCILSGRKNSDLYGPWKRMCLKENGIVTQCIAPSLIKINDQYLTNVLLKINVKMGGINFFLEPPLPVVSSVPTMIIGMSVQHGSNVPSIAAVVGSIGWPLISRYQAVLRTQSPKNEVIDSLYRIKRVRVKGSDSEIEEDSGIFRKLLIDFYDKTDRKPEHIIIFRNGVGESQFNEVLNIEFDQILQACKYLDGDWPFKFTVVVAQKKHHTRFFWPGSASNVSPGVVVDTEVCHPQINDFYMCAHAATAGTTRPTHYHVLHDDMGYSADDLQELVHSLSYVCQRSTTAISTVAPIHYANLAASQMSILSKPDDFDMDDITRGLNDLKLHDRVNNTMFFC